MKVNTEAFLTVRETYIHPSAIVDPDAKIGVGVTIGPYSIIGPKVVLEDNVVVDSHVVIRGRSRIGARTRIYPFASIGTDPQDLKFMGEETELVCGEDNIIREYVNLSIGTEGGGGKTVIGNNNLFMVNCHVAHDCIIGNNCIFANGMSLAGHIEIGDRVVVGGHAGVHQFVKIGSFAMIAGGAILVQDAPPFCTFRGNHASPIGLNLTGLKRADKSKDRIKEIKQMYRLLYQSGLSLEKTIHNIQTEIPESSERVEFVEFLKSSERGISR